MTNSEFVAIVRNKVKTEFYGNKRRAAAKWELSPCYLGEIIKGTREAGPKLLDALGYERVSSIQEKAE